MTREDNTRAAAIAMLRSGMATLSEVADLAGTSRQLVRYWAKAAGVDWQAARAAKLQREFQRRLRKSPKR